MRITGIGCGRLKITGFREGRTGLGKGIVLTTPVNAAVRGPIAERNLRMGDTSTERQRASDRSLVADKPYSASSTMTYQD